MNAVDLLRDLARRGIDVVAVDDELHVDAPRGVLSLEDRAVLARWKSALLAHLRPSVVPTTHDRTANTDVVEHADSGEPAQLATPPGRIGDAVEVVGIADDPCLLCGGTEYRLPADAKGFVHCVRCTEPPPRRRRS